MSEQDFVGKVVKLKSGRLGIVLSAKSVNDNVFFVVLVSNVGLINIHEKDVEIIKG